MKSAIILTTFNRPDALDIVLTSVSKQSAQASQVVIADDGSSEQTLEIVREWQNRLPITHVWQPDTQFRAARIRNLALAKVKTEHVIFIDGDCILPPGFIKQHQQLAGSGHIVSGGRVLLNNAETQRLLDQYKTNYSPRFKNIKFKTLPLGWLRDQNSKDWRQVRTCNLGCMTQDIFLVEGFDEEYIGWGREDSDLAFRLISAGIRVRSGRFAACVLHLYHQEQERVQLSENNRKLEKLMGPSCYHRLPNKTTLRFP